MRLMGKQTSSNSETAPKQQQNATNPNNNNNQTSLQQQQSNTSPSQLPKRPVCRPPLSRRFGHPCSCGQPGSHHKAFVGSTTGYHPSITNPISDINGARQQEQVAAISNTTTTSGNSTTSPSIPPMSTHMNPIHLYDSLTKKCLPTSRHMLLRECYMPKRPTHIMITATGQAANTVSSKQAAPTCMSEDLVCDTRRLRCTCRPSHHLFYSDINNRTSFGCVPIGLTGSPDGHVQCRPGFFYNVINSECQRIFDVTDLPPNYTTGVSATQFSFVTIVLIWILLLILVVTAKLRKLRGSSLCRRSSSMERRLHHHGHSQNSSPWLQPFMAAVNGHSIGVSHHGRSGDRRAHALDDSAAYTDTDSFLAYHRRSINEMLPDEFAGSQHSLNNPPPKFEEIYPAADGLLQNSTQRQNNNNNISANTRLPCNLPPPMPPPPAPPRPPAIPICNDDLPSYDEAMRLQNTMPQRGVVVTAASNGVVSAQTTSPPPPPTPAPAPLTTSESQPPKE